MLNITTRQNPIPEQPIKERIKNYQEIKLGYTPDQAMSEAMRCLRCRKSPCMNQGCPLHNHIPIFIEHVAHGDFEKAYEELTKTTRLSAICSRVCPHENQCEGHCVRGKKGDPVKIGALERFVADWYRENIGFSTKTVNPNGHKVAIIGAGPAGMACACDLNLMGYEVTVFDENSEVGGTMNFGIPEYRLPKAIIQGEVEAFEKRGIKFQLNTEVGVEGDITVKSLFEQGYEALFISDGAVKPTKIDIESNEEQRIYDATDFLSRINVYGAYQSENSEKPLPVGRNVVVIGGGNVAMDASRCAIRSGAENVSIVYRRVESEMPALKVEIEEAKQEGVNIIDLANPIALIKGEDGKVKGLECLRQQLGAPDSSGRHRPVPVEGSNFIVDADMVILATGTTFRPGIVEELPGVERSKSGAVITDGVTATAVEGVYAGGDTVTGPATVVKAMGAGKQAAISIDKYIYGFEK